MVWTYQLNWETAKYHSNIAARFAVKTQIKHSGTYCKLHTKLKVYDH